MTGPTWPPTDPTPAEPTPAEPTPAEPTPAEPVADLPQPVEEPVERTRFAEPTPLAPELAPAAEPAPEPEAQVAAPVAPEPLPAPTPVSLDKPVVPEDVAPPEVEPDELVAPSAVPAPAPAGSGSRVLVPVLAALVAVLAGLTAFLGVQAARTAGADPVDARRAEALSSARESARLVFSYDYRHLAKDFAAGKAVTTGDFAKEYERTTSKLVQDVAPRYKAVVAADVSEASVVQATEDEIVCLVFVNQSSTSSLAPTPKITQSRLEMTLQRQGSRWFVAKIKAL